MSPDSAVRDDPHAIFAEEMVRVSPPLRLGAPVLLVEDNPVNRRVAAIMLGNLGYRVAIAHNGQDALDALTRDTYAAVLMDCQMPEMDGYAATAAIRQWEGDAHHTPIIAITASALRGDRDRCLAAGMDDYLAKPVRSQDLATVLTRWVPADAPTMGAEAEAAETGTEAILDAAVLAQLRDLAQGAPVDIVQEVGALFRTDTPPRLIALRRAVESSDALAANREAHALKGSCAVIGAREMVAVCERLEGMVYTHDLAGAVREIMQLNEAFGRVCAVIDRTSTPG